MRSAKVSKTNAFQPGSSFFPSSSRKRTKNQTQPSPPLPPLVLPRGARSSCPHPLHFTKPTWNLQHRLLRRMGIESFVKSALTTWGLLAGAHIQNESSQYVTNTMIITPETQLHCHGITRAAAKPLRNPSAGCAGGGGRTKPINNPISKVHSFEKLSLVSGSTR